MSKECIEKIKSRQSIRKFTSEPIPDEIIDDIMNIGRTAPSGGKFLSPTSISSTAPKTWSRG